MELKELDILLDYNFKFDEDELVYRKGNYYVAWGSILKAALLVDDSVHDLIPDRFLMSTSNSAGYMYRNVSKELFFKFLSGDLHNLRAMLWNYELEKTLEKLDVCP